MVLIKSQCDEEIEKGMKKQKKEWPRVFSDGTEPSHLLFCKSVLPVKGGVGAFGFLLYDDKTPPVVSCSGAMAKSTNRMELQALTEGLRRIPDKSSVLVYLRNPYCSSVAEGTVKKTRANVDLVSSCGREVSRMRQVEAVVVDKDGCAPMTFLSKCVREELGHHQEAEQQKSEEPAKETTDNPVYVAYTDGACNNASPYGEGGSAYLLFRETEQGLVKVKQSSKGFLHTTNNRMELLAIYSAMLSVPEGGDLVIHTDSQYCITMLDHVSIRYKETLKNWDIIGRWYRDKVRLRKISFVWVKGHDGDPNNEAADALAQGEREQIRRENDIPVYSTRNSPKTRY